MYFALLIIGLIFYIAGAVCSSMDEYLTATILFGVGVLLFIAAFLYSIIPRKHVNKKRTEFVAPYKCSKERVQFAVDIFMKEKEYKPMQYLDEEVYKKGNGWWLARRFIKYTINDDNTVLIEGWIGTGIGNSVATEMNLKGFFGGWPKQQVKKDIEELKFRIGILSD